MRPLPSTWNCGVVVPSDLDVTSLDLKHLQGLSRSLEILTKIRKAKNEYAYRCGKFRVSIQFLTRVHACMAVLESERLARTKKARSHCLISCSCFLHTSTSIVFIKLKMVESATTKNVL